MNLSCHIWVAKLISVVMLSKALSVDNGMTSPWIGAGAHSRGGDRQKQP